MKENYESLGKFVIYESTRQDKSSRGRSQLDIKTGPQSMTVKANSFHQKEEICWI